MPTLRFAPAIGLLALGAFFVFCFEAIGDVYFKGYTLYLGRQTMPTAQHLVFMVSAAFFGGLAATAFAAAFLRLSREGAWIDRVLLRWRSRDLFWIIGLSALAFVIPLFIRSVLLVDTPVTDDESAYQFTAELIASGRLSVESPPLKLFYDRAFMINDGQMYAMYFVGWPALMVPGVWLGVAGFMNAVYFALTVPALFAVARRLVGSSWAKVGALLFVFSPVLLLCASTQMSNTSVVFALTYALWFFLRSQDGDGPAWAHAGCAAMFALAFFIRPTAAVGTGAPIVALWAFRHLRPSRLATRAVVAFVVPAVLSGGLFLYVNKAQTGSITNTGYARELQYARENGLRFTNWTPRMADEASSSTAHFRGDLDLSDMTAATAAAGLRVSWVAFGFPFLFAFLFFARRERWVGLLWAMVLCHFAVHATANMPGLDIFGPHRYVAVVMPLLLLVLVGARRVSQWLAEPTRGLGATTRLLPAAFILITLALNLRMYLPVRVAGMVRMTTSINRPIAKVAELGLENVVIFARRSFAPNCDIHPARHYVYWRPNNNPDRTNSVLWVNHITLEADRRLMRFYPDRKGYLMRWMGDCTLSFIPLEDLEPESVERGFIGGTDEGLPPYPTPAEQQLGEKR